jgi:hypothetical protein
MLKPEQRRITGIEYLRFANAEKRELCLTKVALHRLGSRVYRSSAGRAIKRDLTKEGLRRPDLQTEGRS